jgi:hypothetical protein
MQEIVAQMLNYFWDEFIIINFLPCGRRELSTNLFFYLSTILSTNLRELSEFALIIVSGLGANLIELGVCLAADGILPRICIFFIHEFARIRRICTNYSCGFR